MTDALLDIVRAESTARNLRAYVDDNGPHLQGLGKVAGVPGLRWLV